MRRSTHALVRALHAVCERDIEGAPSGADFWLSRGYEDSAFESLFAHLLGRPDLWRTHHAPIRRLRRRLAAKFDFDEIEYQWLTGEKAWHHAECREFRESAEREPAP